MFCYKKYIKLYMKYKDIKMYFEQTYYINLGEYGIKTVYC